MNTTKNNKPTSSQPEIEELLKYIEININDLNGEIALWQSVIMQAVIDATAQPKDIKSKIERAKTIAWFTHNNDDFLLVCSFAELDPEFVISGLNKILKKKKRPYMSRYNKKHRALQKLSKKHVRTESNNKVAQT